MTQKTSSTSFVFAGRFAGAGTIQITNSGAYDLDYEFRTISRKPGSLRPGEATSWTIFPYTEVFFKSQMQGIEVAIDLRITNGFFPFST